MTNWYQDLDRHERRTLWACFGGWALDGLDVQLYSFVMPSLIVLWQISSTQAGLLATSALLASAVGGWVAGLAADRIGRVRVLQVTIAWFALFTFLAGFTHSFEQLLWIRALQGFGFGGEWAAGSVLMGEVIQARHRGKAVGTVQSAWAVGWAMAALLSTLTLRLLPADWAWRTLFFLGLAPAAAVFFVRRLVAEPAVYVSQRTAGATPPGIGAIFSAGVWRTTLLGSALAVGAQGGYYTITTWLPTFLRNERHFTVLTTGAYLAVIIAGSFAGYLASAHLSDHIGRRRNFILFALGSLLVVLAYTQPVISDRWMLLLGLPLGFFSSGIFSGMGPLYTELYPTLLRGSGQGFCYNVGRGIAAAFPTLVGGLATGLSLRAAIGWFATGAYALVVAMALLLPETRGRPL